jgi:SNF2 family DNA or RNA helicase
MNAHSIQSDCVSILCVNSGAILAHYAGLGKSLTSIAVLHTAMARGRTKSEGGSSIKKVSHALVVAPAMTIVNWVDEIAMWTEPTGTPLYVFNVSCAKSGYRRGEIEKWKKHGGVLLMSHQLFMREAGFIAANSPPQIFVVDEAHRLLKSGTSNAACCLRNISTPRKIFLTGTPLQNHVTEYYALVDSVCPGILNNISAKEFDTDFR